MTQQTFNLPTQLKQDAEVWAARQQISLDQFILWAVAEKIGALNQQLDDLRFPHVTYRRGASDKPVPVIRKTGIRVQTVVIANKYWNMSPSEIASEYGVSEAEIDNALAFYKAHQAEIDATIAFEQSMEKKKSY